MGSTFLHKLKFRLGFHKSRFAASKVDLCNYIVSLIQLWHLHMG